MVILSFIMAHWVGILLALIGLGGIGVGAYKFFSMPIEERYKKVRKWLLYAVIIAEKKWQDGTGLVKLGEVYNMFIEKFPFIKILMPWDTFCVLVDLALDEMREILEDNEKIAAIIKSKGE